MERKCKIVVVRRKHRVRRDTVRSWVGGVSVVAIKLGQLRGAYKEECPWDIVVFHMQLMYEEYQNDRYNEAREELPQSNQMKG